MSGALTLPQQARNLLLIHNMFSYPITILHILNVTCYGTRSFKALNLPYKGALVIIIYLLINSKQIMYWILRRWFQTRALCFWSYLCRARNFWRSYGKEMHILRSRGGIRCFHRIGGWSEWFILIISLTVINRLDFMPKLTHKYLRNQIFILWRSIYQFNTYWFSFYFFLVHFLYS